MTSSAFLGRNVGYRQLAAGLKAGDVRHGLSDGSWNLVDLLTALAEECGKKSRLDLAVWTASGDHSTKLNSLLQSGKLSDIRLMVDRSFRSRAPKPCRILRLVFGDHALRVWSCHAKFAIFTGGSLDVLCMFSANLNQNPRVENFTIWADAEMVHSYVKLVDQAYSAQKETVGFSDSKAGRQLTSELLGPRPRTPSPPLSESDEIVERLRSEDELALLKLSDDRQEV